MNLTSTCGSYGALLNNEYLIFFHNSHVIGRHTQIDSVIKKRVVFSWSNSIAAILFTEGQTINLNSGHQLLLRFGPT